MRIRRRLAAEDLQELLVAAGLPMNRTPVAASPRPTPSGSYASYLQVGPSGSKSWLFRYRVNEPDREREREMGLGAYPTVSLKDARDKAERCTRMRGEGIDPLSARTVERDRERVETARLMTFRDCAEAYIAGNEGAWRNPKHRQQWRNTLKTYAYPLLAELPARAIDAALVLKVLQHPVGADGV